MKDYQKRLTKLLAESGSLFFRQGLRLKDGRPTPYFVNLGVFRTGRLSFELGRCFADWMVEAGLDKQVDVLVGPSYKGSAIAQACAVALYEKHGVDLSFDYDRKEAKTHGEATGKGSMMVTGALEKGSRILIIDDVGTSMATKVELLEKLETLGLDLDVKGVSLAVDREQTQAVYDENGQVVEGQKGPDALAAFTQKTGLGVWSLLGIKAAVNYLHESGEPVLVDNERKPLGSDLLAQVNEYLSIYGREG